MYYALNFIQFRFIFANVFAFNFNFVLKVLISRSAVLNVLILLSFWRWLLRLLSRFLLLGLMFIAVVCICIVLFVSVLQYLLCLLYFLKFLVRLMNDGSVRILLFCTYVLGHILCINCFENFLGVIGTIFK